jgi:hypothetical protein
MFDPIRARLTSLSLRGDKPQDRGRCVAVDQGKALMKIHPLSALIVVIAVASTGAWSG